MKITWEKLLKWFYYATVVIVTIGLITLGYSGDFDIYSIWVFTAYAVGAYLIYQKYDK